MICINKSGTNNNIIPIARAPKYRYKLGSACKKNAYALLNNIRTTPIKVVFQDLMFCTILFVLL